MAGPLVGSRIPAQLGYAELAASGIARSLLMSPLPAVSLQSLAVFVPRYLFASFLYNRTHTFIVPDLVS